MLIINRGFTRYEHLRYEHLRYEHLFYRGVFHKCEGYMSYAGEDRASVFLGRSYIVKRGVGRDKFYIYEKLYDPFSYVSITVPARHNIFDVVLYVYQRSNKK
jgi:hypothetical protein